VITLPWAVIAQDNHRLVPVARGGKGRLVTAAKYRSMKEAAQMLLISQWKGHALDVPVRLAIVLHAPTKQRYDIANRAKMLCDAMTGVVFEDDSLIDDIRFVRGPIDRENPRAEIEITVANPL
jgi:Holliday junction resolvase RusA-like endonuclease